MQPIENAWLCQIDITNYCTRGCLYCSRYNRHLRPDQRQHISLDYLARALDSLEGWPKKVGIIGGEPLMHPHFRKINRLLRKYFPPQVTERNLSNFFGLKNRSPNPHILLFTSGTRKIPAPREDADIKRTYHWVGYNPHDPEQMKKCRHQPLTVAISEAIADEKLMWKLIDGCWVQRDWCPAINIKGAYFCEVGAALDLILNDGANAWPLEKDWWKRKPDSEEFIRQKKAVCPSCGMAIPMDREKLEKKIEKFTPLLLEKFRKAGLRHVSDKDVEIFTKKFSREEIKANIPTWAPGNYSEDLQEDEIAAEGLGFRGSLDED